MFTTFKFTDRMGMYLDLRKHFKAIKEAARGVAASSGERFYEKVSYVAFTTLL